MTSILRAIGIIAIFTMALWPAITSPANVARHVEAQCRHKLMYVAMNDCERARLRFKHVQTKENEK